MDVNRNEDSVDKNVACSNSFLSLSTNLNNEVQSLKKINKDEIMNQTLNKRLSILSDEFKCPICLAIMDNATMLSGCFHLFCHGCILEWLKMKPECPLCKRIPKFFKHNFSKLEKDEKIKWETSAKLENVVQIRSNAEMEAILVKTSYLADVERHAVMQVIQRIEEEIKMLQHISTRGYGSDSIYDRAIRELREEQKEYEKLLGLFNTSSRKNIFNQAAFRRVIYLRNLSPRSIVLPSFGMIFNAEYVENNEELVRSQLTPYIVREYTSLTQNSCVDVDDLLKIIFDYLKNNVNRLVTISHLKKRGIRHPHQFLNNLAHFAGSGQYLCVYDQNSEYTPRSSRVLSYMSGNDDIMVLNSAINNDVQVVGENVNRVRLNRNVLEGFSRRIADLKNLQIENALRQNYAGESSSRTRNVDQNRRTRATNSSIVNIDDSSSSSDLNDNDITYNLNFRKRKSTSLNKKKKASQSLAFVLTPSTNDWRSNYELQSVSQNLLPTASNLNQLNSVQTLTTHSTSNENNVNLNQQEEDSLLTHSNISLLSDDESDALKNTVVDQNNLSNNNKTNSLQLCEDEVTLSNNNKSVASNQTVNGPSNSACINKTYSNVVKKSKNKNKKHSHNVVELKESSSDLDESIQCVLEVKRKRQKKQENLSNSQ